VPAVGVADWTHPVAALGAEPALIGGFIFGLGKPWFVRQVGPAPMAKRGVIGAILLWRRQILALAPLTHPGRKGQPGPSSRPVLSLGRPDHPSVAPAGL